ncbi:hypothetical protein SASPL_109668 [Salvia splendens]|uniref:Pentatricopeptide repeat-containing protein n=1 Tax=Salvia splendens TaxID=180675 RepID=A0A8X8YHK6_SALSN|nr:hypothetical protein SASPL_109668 [Salvia splendens]
MAVAIMVFAPTTFNTVKHYRFRRLCSKDWDSVQSFRSKVSREDELWVFLEQSLQGNYEDYADRRDAHSSDSLAHGLSGERLPLVPKEKFLENTPDVLLPENTTLSILVLHYACNGLFSKALEIWDELMNSACVPDAEEIFSLAISYFGRTGRLECMEILIKEMVSMSYSVDSVTGNAYILYYCAFCPLADVEVAYGRLKRSRILIEEEGIRAIAFAYIKENKFYDLGRFIYDVGIGRRNVGNLLWNLLLLSYASNFN